MTTRATVLYEDSLAPGGSDFPLHTLVMRLVEDQINGETWKLRGAVSRIPCKGVNRVFEKLASLPLFASGRPVLVLVDADRTAEHVGLAKHTPLQQVEAEILRRCGRSAQQVRTYFLDPNMEGLIGHLRHCNPSLEPVAVAGALRKQPVDRDIVLSASAKEAHRPLRECLRGHQPGLDALAKDLSALLTAAPVASPPVTHPPGASRR